MGVMRFGRRRLAVAAGALLVLVGAGGALGSWLRLSLGSSTLVSKRFPDRGGPCASPGITYRDSAAEPTITSDPVHPRQLLAAWIAAPGYDRLDQAGADDLVSRSDDSGRHWRLIPLRGSTQCNGGSEPKIADPALAWAADGRSYFLANPGNAETGIPVTRLVFYRLDPGGRRYAGPISIPAPVGYNDRPSITIDPSNSQRLEVIWTFRHQNPELDALDDVMIAISKDRGQTWSVRKVYTGAGNEFIWGLQLFHIGRRDRLITYRGKQGASTRFYALRSHDGGHTWSAPRVIGSGSPGYPVSEGKVMPPGASDLAAQGRDGSVDVAWDSTSPDGRERILIARTADAGRSWSHPRVVANVQCDVFMPAVAVNGRATIGVSYYAFRECGAGQQGPGIEARFAASGDEGRHWRTVRLGGPFDVRNIITPEHGGRPFPAYFLGDYMGLTASGDDFAATFILPKPYARFGQQNVFFRRIKAG